MEKQVQLGGENPVQDVQSGGKVEGERPISLGIKRDGISEQSGSNVQGGLFEQSAPIRDRTAVPAGPANHPSGNSNRLSLIGTMLKGILNVLVKLGWMDNQTAQNLLARFLVEIENELDRSEEAIAESSQETPQITPENLQRAGKSDRPEVGVQPAEEIPESSQESSQENPEVAAFNELNICQTHEQKVTLNALISQLKTKDPNMLIEIFNNCQWLKGRAQDDFIYSVAVASMQMELADVFDQTGFDDLPNGMQVEQDIMLGSESGTMYSKIFDTASMEVLEKTRGNFSNMLNALPKPPGVESFGNKTTNADMLSGVWRWWAQGGTSSVRSCVDSDILPKNRADPWNSQPMTKAERDVYMQDECVRRRAVISNFLPMEYAYSQLLFRHMTFPGQEEGSPPTFLAIRKIHAFGYERITGESIEEGISSEAKHLTYSVEKALPAESWSVVSAVTDFNSERYGTSAIYGKIPVYSVLTSVFSQTWNHGQKELVVVPFSDISITAEAQFNEIEYEERIVLPAMERQYGAENPSVKEAREQFEKLKDWGMYRRR